MASKKKSTHLGVGEFDGGQVVTSARRYFLWAIQKNVPLVSEQLRDDVLRPFLETKKNTQPSKIFDKTAILLRHQIVSGTIEISSIAQLRKSFGDGLFVADEQFTGFLKALFVWSSRWNLDADWLTLRALRTLNSWSKNKVFLLNLQWSSPLFGLDTPESEPQPPGGFPSWDVFDESAKAYLLRIEPMVRQRLADDDILSQAEASHRNDFVRHLSQVAKNYQAVVSEFYKRRGYKPVNRQELIKHINWAISFQVLGDTFVGIANSSGVEPQAVRKAVKSVLNLIEVNQRITKPGRPLGTKDSTKRHIADLSGVR